ncbi:MAG TPA: TetR/AcrR family transcriptional regulator [Paraburkholderia sp.]|nr:TetR/AcrR family transcriptional regulator [Paraburkholderia sp.]
MNKLRRVVMIEWSLINSIESETGMARPKSEDKRNAILAAATQVIAGQGLGAPTARIAKVAGVAEGTLFTYFENKDELLNELYLNIKSDMREMMMAAYPKTESIQNRARHVWHKYVDWGVAHPQKRRAMAQLTVSDRLTEQTRAAGMQAFADVNTMMQASIASGVLRDHPTAFVAAIMGALAETTMDFMERDTARAERYRDAGFEAFWRAVAKT